MTPELQSKLTRAVMAFGSIAVVALNKKFGLGLDVSDIASIAAIVVGFISSSNWKEAKLAGHDAAVQIATVKDAATVIGTPPKEGA